VGSLIGRPENADSQWTPYSVQTVGCVVDAKAWENPAGTCTIGYPGPLHKPTFRKDEVGHQQSVATPDVVPKHPPPSPNLLIAAFNAGSHREVIDGRRLNCRSVAKVGCGSSGPVPAHWPNPEVRVEGKASRRPLMGMLHVDGGLIESRPPRERRRACRNMAATSLRNFEKQYEELAIIRREVESPRHQIYYCPPAS